VGRVGSGSLTVVLYTKRSLRARNAGEATGAKQRAMPISTAASRWPDTQGKDAADLALRPLAFLGPGVERVLHRAQVHP
jgi:hypothetical protein